MARATPITTVSTPGIERAPVRPRRRRLTEGLSERATSRC
jgi:hypothetical protein